MEENIDDICRAISDPCRSDFQILADYWKKIGLSESQFNERTQVFKEMLVDKIKQLTSDMIDESKRNVKELEERCDTNLRKIELIWQELECEGEPNLPSGNLDLLQREKELRDQLTLLSKEKECRLANDKVLIDEDKKLSEILGVRPTDVEENKVLTEDLTIELENHISDLKKEMETRENQMFTIKEEILRLMEELEMDLNTSSLSHFFDDGEEERTLTKAMLRNVQKSMETLRETLAEKTREAAAMVKEIVSLYERLEVPDEEKLPLALGQVGLG